jgi:nucleoside-diphosphate-sugar epimerase
MVTGGTGFLGSHIVDKLVKCGCRVVVYARSEKSEVSSNIVMFRGDVTNIRELLEAITNYNIDTIIHCSAILVPESQQNPYEAFKINAEGTVNVLEAARLKDIKRVIYMSSIRVYGNMVYEPIDEDHPKNPVEFYGVTKLFGELYGFNYERNYGIEFIAFRPSMIYGPKRTTGNVIHKLIVEYAINGKPFKMPYGGDTKYDFIYVKDCAEAVYLALEAKHLEHKVFNLASGKSISLQEFVKIVKKFIPNASIELGPGLLPNEPLRGTIDNTRIKKILGWEPQYDIEHGIKEYIEWLKKQHT